MFEKVLSAKPEGTAILIVETGDGGSRDLLLSYVQHRRQQQVLVTLVPGGQSAADLPGTSVPASHWQTVAEIREELEAALPAPGPPACLLALQEASCLVHWLGPATLCQLMRHVCDRGHQVVLVVSEEAIGEEWLSQLRHYSTHVLTVEGTSRDLTVSGTYRFKAGKLETAVERVCLSGELQVSRVEPARPAPAAAVPRPAPAAPLAPGLTTFSLQLSETEKQSRSRLVLPYLRPEQGGGDSAPGTGQIFYQPDAADDWDEEDPDDDLDI